MEREKRDLYDENSQLTGKTYLKGDTIPQGFYPMVVMACIQNKKGEFLMQKRVPAKGGDWGVTGGHPKAGETPIEGMITEIKEEIGVDIKSSDLQVFSEGCDGVDCYKMYYFQTNYDLRDFVIQEEELSEVKWFSMQELQDMVEKKILNPNQIACFKKCVKFLDENKKIR